MRDKEAQLKKTEQELGDVTEDWKHEAKLKVDFVEFIMHGTDERLEEIRRKILCTERTRGCRK